MRIFSTLSLIFLATSVFSQDSTFTNRDTVANSSTIATQIPSLIKKVDEPGKNIVKINLSSAVIKNYSFQYERAISKKVSFALGFRTMGKSSVPFEAAIEDFVDDPAFKVSDFRMSNYAITPEVRWYLSKRGWMRGFYVAAYARYSSFNLDAPVTYNSTFIPPVPAPQTPITVQKTAVFSGTLNAFSGGLMTGMQYTFGKYFTLDIWLVGGHLGKGNGNLVFAVSPPLSSQEQAELKKTLDKAEVPLVKLENTVDANGGTIKASGTWAGVRAVGINFGIRF